MFRTFDKLKLGKPVTISTSYCTDAANSMHKNKLICFTRMINDTSMLIYHSVCR